VGGAYEGPGVAPSDVPKDDAPGAARLHAVTYLGTSRGAILSRFGDFPKWCGFGDCFEGFELIDAHTQPDDDDGCDQVTLLCPGTTNRVVLPECGHWAIDVASGSVWKALETTGKERNTAFLDFLGLRDMFWLLVNGRVYGLCGGREEERTVHWPGQPMVRLEQVGDRGRKSGTFADDIIRVVIDHHDVVLTNGVTYLYDPGGYAGKQVIFTPDISSNLIYRRLF